MSSFEPEDVEPAPAGVPAHVTEVLFEGDRYLVRAQTASGSVWTYLRHPPARGETVAVRAVGGWPVKGEEDGDVSSSHVPESARAPLDGALVDRRGGDVLQRDSRAVEDDGLALGRAFRHLVRINGSIAQHSPRCSQLCGWISAMIH